MEDVKAGQASGRIPLTVEVSLKEATSISLEVRLPLAKMNVMWEQILDGRCDRRYDGRCDSINEYLKSVAVLNSHLQGRWHHDSHGLTFAGSAQECQGISQQAKPAIQRWSHRFQSF